MTENRIPPRGITPNKVIFILISVIVIGVATLTVVDGLIKPPYAVKSAIKFLMFLQLPILPMMVFRIGGTGGLFRIKPKKLLLPLGLGFAVYAVILCLFLLLRNSYDFSGITASLAEIGVTRENFIFVSLYISFINSLLEEFFFRGIGFIILGRYTGMRSACLIGSLSFAVYHVAMMIGWYSPLLTLTVIIGLFAGGAVLNLVDVRSKSIIPSWIIHIFANLSINTAGFILFTT